MKKVKAKVNEQSSSLIQLLGMLLIGFAVLDFALSWMGVNLTSFMGPISRFSPMIVGFIGLALIKEKMTKEFTTNLSIKKNSSGDPLIKIGGLK